MAELNFAAGMYLSAAAEQLVRAANTFNQVFTGDFNDITMTANPGDNPKDVEAAYRVASDARNEAYRNSPEGMRAAQEAEDRKNACQAAIDKLMVTFENLDFTNLDELVQFFDDMADSSDHIGVSFDRQRIIDEFAKHGFTASMNCGGKFDGSDRENFAGYLIGQAIDGLGSVGAVHHIYHKFAEEWRSKFGVTV